MAVNPDFRDLFAALNAAGARYLLVGGYLVFQIGVPPNRIDIVTAIDGVEFAEGWSGRAETTYGDQVVPVIGRTELIRNKRASGRPQDLLDLEILERA